jgi:hypothetical protein
VTVTVRNTICYAAPATARLREHETVHARINTAEALRMEETLKSFAYPGPDAGRAERAFRAEFRRRVAAVTDLHRAWDTNHTFPVYK